MCPNAPDETPGDTPSGAAGLNDAHPAGFGKREGMGGAGRGVGPIMERLPAVYAALDRKLAAVLAENVGADCRACGRCCTFPPQGDVLYASAPEREFLASVPPPPGEHPAGSCPYLRQGKCTARERRPVGCRCYFCVFVLPSREARDECRSLAEEALAELRRIVEEFDADWDYAPVVERLAARGIR